MNHFSVPHKDALGRIDDDSNSPSYMLEDDMIEEPEETSVLMPVVSVASKRTPTECHEVQEGQGRTPLHVACDNDAPAVVIQAMLRAYPEASMRVGTSNMNPLHITCSSLHASVHVVRALLEFGRFEQFSMRDVDGDTPLHAACRCGAPIEVLQVLLHHTPGCQSFGQKFDVLHYVYQVECLKSTIIVSLPGFVVEVEVDVYLVDPSYEQRDQLFRVRDRHHRTGLENKDSGNRHGKSSVPSGIYNHSSRLHLKASPQSR